MMNKEEIVAQATSLKFSLDEMHSYIAIFGAGVIVGFVGKRFFSLVILSTLVALFIVKGLESQDILKIDWTAVTSYFGLDVSLSLNHLAKDLYYLAADNISLTGAAVCGFLVGYKAG